MANPNPNRNLFLTNAEFSHFDDEQKEHFRAFARRVLWDCRYKIVVGVVNGQFVWRRLPYFHLPRTNALRFQDGGEDHVDELLDFTNALLEDKEYRKRIGFVGGEFVLEGIEPEDPEPQQIVVDQNVPLDPVLNEALFVSSIFAIIVETNATAANPLRVGELEQRLTGKLAARGIILQPGTFTQEMLLNSVDCANELFQEFHPLGGAVTDGSTFEYTFGVGGGEDTIHMNPR